MRDGEVQHGGTKAVKRIGDTVVRSAGPQSPSVHRLLRHVRRRGFLGGPVPVALEADGDSETLSFLPGLTSNYPLHEAFRSDRALTTAARLLRHYHDASEDFVPRPTDRWFLPAVQPVEVICHGDFAPYNCVMEEGSVTGVFDFDTAHPGPRLWDVGYAAYRWAPLTAPGNSDGFGDAAEQQRRLLLFCHSYGIGDFGSDPASVVAAAAERLTALVATMRRLAEAGDAAFAGHISAGHDQLYLRDISHLRSLRLHEPPS